MKKYLPRIQCPVRENMGQLYVLKAKYPNASPIKSWVRGLVLILGSILTLVLAFSYQTSTFGTKTMSVVFCDVGQGDAIYIRTPGGADILVDGGPSDRVLKCLEQNMPFWDKTLELVFATHPDADHITGLVSVIERYRLLSFNTISKGKETVIYKKLKAAIERNKIPYRELVAGDRFSLEDGVRIDIKWPAKDFEDRDVNNYSLTTVFKYKDFDLLLTGDLGFEILNSLTFDSPIEVFKLPHHGSKTGVDDETFKKFRFLLAVISAGKNNSYHHPHPSVLALLKKYNVPYKRTDLEGGIRIVTDGKTTKILNN